MDHRYYSRFAQLVLCLLLFILCIRCKSLSEVNNQKARFSDADSKTVAKDIHDRILVLDAHSDITLPTTSSIYLSADGRSKTAIDKLNSGGMNALVMTLAVPPGARTPKGDAQAKLDMDLQLQIVTELVNKNPYQLRLTKSSSDINSAFSYNQIAIILGFQNARALQRDVSSIDSFYQKGVRIFGLNHIGHNDFSDSSRPFFDGETGVYEPADVHHGLSDLGKSAIKRINELGALVDVSQMSKSATLQAVQLSTHPVIASHSNVRAISDVSRNLSDEEIDLIAEKGGVICVSPFRAYLLDYSDSKFVERIKAVRRNSGISEIYSYPFELYWEIKEPEKKLAFLQEMSDTLGSAYVDDLVLHIDYIVNRVGINHVGIGSDFNHGGGIDNYSDAADALEVTIALYNKGYSEDDIRKIWSGNFLRTMQKVEMK